MSVDVKPGYKQTEVGVIPEEWDAVQIGRIAAFTSGKGIAVSSLHPPSSDNPVPVFGGNGIAGYTSRSLVNEPVVVVGRVGQKCGEVYVTMGPSWITDNALYPKALGRPVHIPFFALAMKVAGLNDVKNRNDLPLVTQSILHSVRLAWPPDTAEQRAIAEALSNVDSLLSGLDGLIAKKRDLKLAAMQQLFTGKTRLPGFEGEWEVKRLGNMGQLLKGRGVTKDQTQSGELPCVRYGELYTHHDIVVRTYYSWISPNVARSATRIQYGDILFAGSGETKEEIGKCAAFIDDVEAYAGGDIIILRPYDANPVFLGYLLNSSSINRQKSGRGQGDAVVHIGRASIGAIQCHIPKLPEQTAIAAILSDMDAELTVLEQRRDKTRALKQGMMQELLAGRIRLI